VSARVAARLAARFEVDAWPALCVRVVSAGPRDAGTGLATPAHYLAAAWSPCARGPQRWPEAVALGSPDADRALAELLAQLPEPARLFLVTPDDVDGALAAAIVLAVDRHLEEYQRAGLEAFVAHEQARTRQRIADRYTDRDAGFERFRTRAGVPRR
jgi:hypothetical protein